jgi:hypothetical protein
MLDKTGQTGSPLQLVNGLILISTFACARLGYGWIMVRASFDPRVQFGYRTISRMGSFLSLVVPIYPNVIRGAGWALECHLHQLRLWKHHPERPERVLVRLILRFGFSFLSFPWSCGFAEGILNRFSKMIAALQKRFTAKDAKAQSAPQHMNVVDGHGTSRSESEQAVTRRGEARR